MNFTVIGLLLIFRRSLAKNQISTERIFFIFQPRTPLKVRNNIFMPQFWPDIKSAAGNVKP